MMSKNNALFKLSLITLVLLALGLWMSGQKSTTDVALGPLLQNFQEHANDIEEVKIQRNDDSEIVLSKVDSGWKMTSHYGYEVDTKGLSELLSALASAQKVQAKTALAKNHYRLGLQDISDDDSKASKLTLKGSSNSWELLVGSSPNSGAGHYVRFVDDPQTWLIDKALTLPDSATQWLRKDMLSISAEDVSRINIGGMTGVKLTKEDAEQDNFDLSDLGEGRELSYPGVTDGPARNIANLTLEDVRPWDNEFWSQLTASHVVSYSTFNEGSGELEFKKDEQGNYWLKLVKNGKQANWLYQVPQYSAEQLNKELEDFLKPLPSQDSTEEKN